MQKGPPQKDNNPVIKKKVNYIIYKGDLSYNLFISYDR